MKKSQLNAISRSYQADQLKGQQAVLVKYDLVKDFEKSGYKSITAYLKRKYKEGVIQYWNEVYGK